MKTLLLALLAYSVVVHSDELGFSGQLIDGTREVTVVARDFEFEPNPIVVATGEHVRLRVTSEEGHHGFALKDFGINDKDIVPGREAVFEFVADQAGDHAIRCSHLCGIGHLGMKATFSVR